MFKLLAEENDNSSTTGFGYIEYDVFEKFLVDNIAIK